MKKVLDDRLKVREKEDGREEWSFKAPSYDNRTSHSIPAGNYYGSGVKNPVGTEKCSSMESGPIPQSTYSFSPKEIFGRPTGKINYDGEDKKG